MLTRYLNTKYVHHDIYYLGGIDFIKHAYWAVLGRFADEDGLNHYQNLIVKKVTKIEILFQIRNSPEGRLRVLEDQELEKIIANGKKYAIPLLRYSRKLGMSLNSFFNVSQTPSHDALISLSQFRLRPPFEVERLYHLVPDSINLEFVNIKNPNLHVQNIAHLRQLFFCQPPFRKILLSDHKNDNAFFYSKIAEGYFNAGMFDVASELFLISLQFADTHLAHEYLGKLALKNMRLHSAIFHYDMCIRFGGRSTNIYVNIAKIYLHMQKHKIAIARLVAGIKTEKDTFVLLHEVDSAMTLFWQSKMQQLELDTHSLRYEYSRLSHYVSKIYRTIYSARSAKAIQTKFNADKVLIVTSGTSDEHRYISHQKISLLRQAGYLVQSLDCQHTEKILAAINFFDIIIISNVQTSVEILKSIQYATCLGKITIADVHENCLIDDVSSNSNSTLNGEFHPTHYFANKLKAISLQLITEHCDYVIASTKSLLDILTPLSKTKNGYLHPYAFDAHNVSLLHKSLSYKEQNTNRSIVIIYVENQHDDLIDFKATVLPSIIDLLKDNCSIKLKLVSSLELLSLIPEKLSPQISHFFPENCNQHTNQIFDADIVIRAKNFSCKVTSNVFEDWSNICLNKIVCLASIDSDFKYLINDGIDGFLIQTPTEWLTALLSLINNPTKFRRIAEAAHHRVLQSHSVDFSSSNLDSIIRRVIQPGLDSSALVRLNSKKKIALVNVLYPPRAYGGATRVVSDEAASLMSSYGNEFEVVAFTCNSHEGIDGQLNVYSYDGYRVYEVTKAFTESTNWTERDEHTKNTFINFLEFEKPDIVHFHCMQVLSASLLEATLEYSIPYFVTVHDGWWISDYQFLVDDSGTIYPNGHPTERDLYKLRNGITLEQSLNRKIYLKRQLLRAEKVFCVSESFEKIYQQNGITNTSVNKNGISSTLKWLPKNTTQSDKVICAYVGGYVAHKGFEFFRNAVINIGLKNIEFLVIDHSKAASFSEVALWGTNKVKIIGHVNQDEMVGVYRSIDVLLAPSACVESYGLVTREAAACGCWVVASNIGGIGEDIDDSNGFKIPPTQIDICKILKIIDTSPAKFKLMAASKPVRFSSSQTDELIPIFRQVTNRIQHLDKSAEEIFDFIQAA